MSEIATCWGITNLGRPCNFPPRRGTNYCLNHEPGADTVANATRAARAAAIKRTSSAHLITAVIALDNREGIQATLDAVVRLNLAGRLPDRRAEILIRACATAARNFDRATESLDGPVPQSHNGQRYVARVKALLSTIDPLLSEAIEIEETKTTEEHE